MRRWLRELLLHWRTDRGARRDQERRIREHLRQALQQKRDREGR